MVYEQACHFDGVCVLEVDEHRWKRCLRRLNLHVRRGAVDLTAVVGGAGQAPIGYWAAAGLYRIRRALLTGQELLIDVQKARLRSAFVTEDVLGAVEFTQSLYR